MIEESQIFKELIKNIQQVPYLASKNIYRAAAYFLALEPEKMEQFCKVLLRAKEHIVRCQECCTWKEKDKGCFFCDMPKRDKSVICVVETWHELIVIEKTGGYNGLYHVLGGAICPLEGIGPEDLTFEQLFKRIKDPVKELILATNQTPEGEATAAYIANHLKETDVGISCLARGVPVGSTLEYMDRVTIFKALSERKPF